MGAQGYYYTGGVISDLKRFNELVTNLQVLSNVQVKDLSDRHDIRLTNLDAYQYQQAGMYKLFKPSELLFYK